MCLCAYVFVWLHERVCVFGCLICVCAFVYMCEVVYVRACAWLCYCAAERSRAILCVVAVCCRVGALALLIVCLLMCL